jgi:hypothetical protein
VDHLAAYTASIANGSTLLQLAALADGIMPTRDSAFITSKGLDHVMFVFGFGTNLTRIQLQPPSVRRFGNFEVKPFTNASPGAGVSIGAMFMADNPLPLEVGEEVPVYVIQGAAGAQQEYAFVRFTDGPKTPIKGKILTIRATGTTTLVANAWTQCALTFDTALPNNKFKVVGARCKTAGGLGFRFINSQSPFRPGGICDQSDLAIIDNGQRRGGWGQWFEFDYLTPPTLEVLSTSADTAQTLELDVIAE